MFTQLIGLFTILIGLLWTIRPDFLRGWLVYKAHRLLFWALVGSIVYPVIHLYGKQIGWKGAVAVVIVFCVAMGAVRSRIRAALEHVPLMAFRAAGVFNIGAGAALIWWPKQ